MVWVIDNRTPFAAERNWTRDESGAEVWLVAVRATFDLADDGTLTPVDPQPPVNQAPVWRGDALRTSLLHDTDFGWGKPATDVLIQGSAFAPEGVPATALDIGFQVGPVQRLARVTGDRRWLKSTRGLTPSAPEPFTTMPLTWERAYGGASWDRDPPAMEARNPVGTGFWSRGQDGFGRKLPNIEGLNELIHAPDHVPEPMGFGPVTHNWLPRARYAGTYGAAWEEDRKPLLAKDFDRRYQQSAPPQQQVQGHLRGGEQAALLNLHPRRPKLTFLLPRLSLRFVTRFRRGANEEHRATLSTVAIDTIAMQVAMAYLTELPCHWRGHDLLETRMTLREWLNVKLRNPEFPLELGA